MSNLLWVAKYSPPTIDGCILPESVKAQAKAMVESQNFNHLLLIGPPGTGKTSLAMAMIKELDADYIVYNGSDGSLNLDQLRNNIADFAHTSSLGGRSQHKIIFIDEADGLGHLTQAALRNAMEKYARNCRFILTGNCGDKIIAALHSRCATINYKFEKSELNILVRQFARRTTEILKAEGVTYDVEALKGVILKYFPDNRKILNEMQRYAIQNGTIDAGILAELKSNTDELFDAILVKDFSKTKHWLANNSVGSIFNTLYKEGDNRLPKELLPLWIIKIGEAQRFHNSVPNQELNVLAALTEFMAES